VRSAVAVACAWKKEPAAQVALTAVVQLLCVMLPEMVQAFAE